VPELPEVEVVRRGLSGYLPGRTIVSVQVRHPRAVRRHQGPDLAAELVGAHVRCVSRRGKYLWLPLADHPDDASRPVRALVGHLGMSGQLLLPERGSAESAHLRVLAVIDGPRDLHFVDQRTFGGVFVDDLVPDDAAGRVPASIAHIARDLLDPVTDVDAVARRMRRRDTEVKRALLDQTLVSGIGNIYADEALWRARVHGRRSTARLTQRAAVDLLVHAREVMAAALAQGGTSFDSLYVNVNGESGWFERSLDAYGRVGLPCSRCGTPIRRESFMNRSSYFCPRCQRPPRVD
jgi:formamidopyrimidine-DNA glycosylase